MDEINKSGSHPASSPMMESPLMQLANASLSAMRASLSPKEITNSEDQTKSSLFPASPSINNTVPLSLLSNTSIDSFAGTHVPLKGIVPSVSDPSLDKHIEKSALASSISVIPGTPVLENIDTPEISKHRNLSPQVTGSNFEVTTTQEKTSHNEHLNYSLPNDETSVNATKSSVSDILTSDSSSHISTVTAADIKPEKTNIPKDLISQQSSSQSISPISIPLPSSINTSNSQRDNVTKKNSISKFLTSESGKSISYQQLPESTLTLTQISSIDINSLQSVPSIVDYNPASLCTLVDSHKNMKGNSKIKHSINAGLVPITSKHSHPSKNPIVLSITTSSTPTTTVLHSGPLSQVHAITQPCTHSPLNEFLDLRESKNILDNGTIGSDTISGNTPVTVPPILTAVKLNPTVSHKPIPAKSHHYIPPYSIGTDMSSKKTNLLSTNNASMNSESKVPSSLSKKSSKNERKDIASSSVRVLQDKSEISSKHRFPITSSKVVGPCTSVANTSALASTAKCNPVMHTLPTSTTHYPILTTNSSAASCTYSVSTCTPISSPNTVADSPTAVNCPLSVPSYIPSLITSTHPATYISVPSTSQPLTTPYCSSTVIHKSGVAINTLVTATSLANTTISTSAVPTCIPVIDIQPPKNLKTVHEYEIKGNKSHVHYPSANVTKRHSGMFQFTGKQSKDIENTDEQNYHVSTPAMAIDTGTNSKPQNTSVHNEAPSSIAGTEKSSSIAGTEKSSSITGTEAPSSVSKTRASPSITETEVPSPMTKTVVPSSMTEIERQSSNAGAEVPSSIAETIVPLSILKTREQSSIAEAEMPSSIAVRETPSSLAKIEAFSSIDTVKAPSSDLPQLLPGSDEFFAIGKKSSSDKKKSGCKLHSNKSSKTSLSTTVTNLDSSTQQSPSTISDCMTKLSSSSGESVPFDQKSESASTVNTVSTVADDTKKSLLKKKKSSKISSSEVTDKPPAKKLLKKVKPSEKGSKSPTVSKTLSNSSLLSTTTKKELIGSQSQKKNSSDLSLSSSYAPKSAKVLDENVTISSDEKSKSLISSVKSENAVSNRGNDPTITEGSSISTRPRRIIKARRLFSSSPYSTGSANSDTEENSSSSSKQRKRVRSQSTDEEKKSTSTNSIKKPQTNKAVLKKETCSPPKKSVSAIKTNSSVDSSKTSPNVEQVPLDTSVPTDSKFLNVLGLASVKKESGKIIKTPTMASNSGVTSTSPTYSNSKRNVATKCSTLKEQKSTDSTLAENDKTSYPLVSSSKTTTSKNTLNASPANNSENTNEDISGECNTLKNSAEKSLSRKRKNPSGVDVASDSCGDLSKHIAEAERFIKKEPVDDIEFNQKVTEDNIETTSQISSEVGSPTKVTKEIRKLLNTDSSSSQVSLASDLIPVQSSPGNNLSQPRPLAPVQLGSPYAIFLPVSLASNTTTTATTPPSSAPLYSIQLNVPNVVRMGKPYPTNDSSITKKHCTIVPAPNCPKIDNSGMKSHLISRNNLIATYYPAPLPESLMNKITVNYHVCGECGDTFLFKSSLTAHKTRKCMQLTYNCDNCTMKLVFYNKCSVLEHIRSHYPSRPVTIKLDRMEVMPLPEGITDVLELENESECSNKDQEESAKFDCLECGAKFHSARALADHFGHSEILCSFTFYCALCQTYLPRHCAQLAHRRVHHEKPPHVCPECGLLIPNLLTFREHLKYKCLHFSRIAPLVCPKCNSKFCYTPELKEHIISVHSETFIKCSICPMAFKASASYQTHHQNTHSSEPEQKKEIYKCPLCDTVFHSIQQLMNHVEIHIGELKKDISYAFRCSICSSIFSKRAQLVSHLGTTHHLEYVQHRCEFCDCVCKTAHNLQTHQRAIHKVELKKFESSKSSKTKGETAVAKTKKIKKEDVTHCSLCHIFFATLAQLQMHTLKVHQKRTNDDSTEELETSSSAALAPKNKNSQKFCRYCKAPYKSWSRLMQHILGHRNSGVYICLICTCAAFISKEELSKHEEFCSGENLHDKPPAVYECQQCHQLFKQESWLIAHQKNIHPKKGEFTCHLCGLTYKSNSSLRKHMLSVHDGKKSFCCYKCKELNKEKIFRCQSQLEKHLIAKHNMSLDQMTMKQYDIEAENDDEKSTLLEERNEKIKQAAPKKLKVNSAKRAKLSKTPEETYICAKCNFTNQNFDIFKLHILEHKTIEDGIQCDTCGLCFTAVDSLRMHLFAVHKIKRSNDSLRDQGVNKSPVSKVIEDSSPSTVQSPATNTSTTIVALDNIPPVESTSKTAETVKRPPETTVSDSKSSSCQCNVCYKTFESEHLLKVHMRTHGMAFIRSKRHTISE